MPANLTINSCVVDLTKDKPKKEDLFFVDTNVWYWLTYTKASSPAISAAPYQTQYYPTYASDALHERCALYSTGLNISELSHLIENSEFLIHKTSNPNITKKEFRHNLANQRTNVCTEVEAACRQVLELSEQLELTVDRQKSENLITDFPKYKIDGYDFLNLEAMKLKGITKIITDDGDFATIPGITLFTANRNVIAAAKAQNKLVAR